MQQNDQTEQYIIVNTPKNINLDSIFPTFNKNLEKVYWLINQINHFSTIDYIGYTINIENHNWLFSSNNITGKILKVLIENNIIYQTKKYVVGKSGRAYKMVKPFKADDSSNQTFYQIGDSSNPKFIKRFIADGFTVKNKETSSYRDEPNILNVAEQHNGLLVEPTLNQLLEKIKILEMKNNELVLSNALLQSRLDTANAKAKQNRLNKAIQETTANVEVVTPLPEVEAVEPVILAVQNENEVITLENCDDLEIPENKAEIKTNIIDAQGLTLTEVYYVLEENGYDIISTDYSTYYDFEDFKISLNDGQVIGEGDMKLIQSVINKNVEAFLNRKKLSVA